LLGQLSTFRKENFATAQVLSDNSIAFSNQLIYWYRPKTGKKIFEFLQSISEEDSVYEISSWNHYSISKNMLINTPTSSKWYPTLRLKQKPKANDRQLW